jgi:hypothetical protein
MLLPLWTGLVKTTHYDPEMAKLADRHYSRRTPGASQFAYAGRKLVLRDTQGTVLWVWMWPYDELRMDKQTGYNCAIFRNESSRRSSDIILEAEQMAFAKWGPNRVYTYVAADKIKSTNPGFCFQCAGWTKVGKSKGGLILLTKEKP